jgi:hypothetical protein
LTMTIRIPRSSTRLTLYSLNADVMPSTKAGP